MGLSYYQWIFVARGVAALVGLPLLWLAGRAGDRWLKPRLHRMHADGRIPRRIFRAALALLGLTLILWAAGVSLTWPLFYLGRRPVSAAVLILFAIGLTLAEGVSRILGHLAGRRTTWLEPSQSQRVADFVRWSSVLVAVLFLLTWLGLDLTAPMVNLGGQGISVQQVGFFIVYVAGVLIGSKVIGHVVAASLPATRFNSGMRYAVGRIVYYTCLVLGLAVSLELVGLRFGSLAVALGAVGVGIGLGLQGITNNFVSGLILLLERPVEVGDKIVVGDVSGRVRHIGTRSTTIRTPDNISLVIPNGDMTSKQITNWSHGDPTVRLHLTVRVTWGANMRQVQARLLEIAAAHPLVLPQPPVDVWVKSFEETHVVLELLVWFNSDKAQAAKVRSDLYYEVYQALEEAGVSGPFGQTGYQPKSLSQVVTTPA